MQGSNGKSAYSGEGLEDGSEGHIVRNGGGTGGKRAHYSSTHCLITCKGSRDLSFSELGIQ